MKAPSDASIYLWKDLDEIAPKPRVLFAFPLFLIIFQE